MKCFIPETLNIDQLILSYPPHHIERFHRDYLVYIPHLLTAIPAMDKGLELKEGYVPIKASMLQSKISNYKSYLTYLMETNVIETDGWYAKGKKCIGYKFTAFYFGRVRGVELQDQRIAKKLFKPKPIGFTMQKKYGHLIRWFDNGLQIRYDLALDFIVHDLDRKLENPALRDCDHRTGEFKNPVTQYNTALCAVEKIAARAFPISVDSEGFRLHSVLSNLRGTLRNCLTYNGLGLVSIDIANSQPYLVNLLLRSSFWEKQGFIGSLHCNDLISIDRVFTASSLSSFIMIVKSAERLEKSGFQAYKEIVRTGQFYDYMEEMMRRELKISHIDRKAVKAAVFQLLFTDNRFIGQKEAGKKRTFKRLFPEVYQLLSLIKRKDKRNLPILLQRIESHLVLEVITKRIARDRTSIPLFTIHDSIVTTVGNEGYVQEVIRQEMEKAVGFAPQLRAEYWMPEHLCFGDGTPFIEKAAA
ncbi:MAG TPA: hypothetical protein VGN00_29260 [Puia sp.]|jgi:hypothetical protein